jgi:YbbR domain-containing protein
VKFNGLPENLIIKDGLPTELDVQIKVLSTLFTSAEKLEIAADIDLSKIHEGVNSITVDGKSFQLPPGVSVVKVSPAVLKISAEKKMFRDIPVYLKRSGRLPKGVKIKSISIKPDRVRVLGYGSSLAQLRQVDTESLDLSKVTNSGVFEVKLLTPSPQVQLNSHEPVKVTLEVSKLK